MFQDDQTNAQLSYIADKQIEESMGILDATSNLRERMSSILKEFSELPTEIRGTKKLISQLNKDMVESEKLNKTLSDSRSSMMRENSKQRPQAPERKNVDELNPRQRKKYEREVADYENNVKIYEENIQKKSEGISSAMEKSFKLINDASNRLNSLQEIKNKHDEKISKNNSGGGKSPNNQPSDTPKDEASQKRSGWFKPMSAEIGKSVLGAMKIAMIPVTMPLNVISGMVSGIWNSHLASIAKTGALIGMVLWGFDWLQLAMEKVGKKLEKGMGDFSEKMTPMENTMKDIYILWESLKKYFDDDYQSKWLDNSKVGFLDLVSQAGALLMSLLKDGLSYLWSALIAQTKNAFHSMTGMGTGGHTAESVYQESLENTNYKDTDINSRNYKEVNQARLSQEKSKMAGVIYEAGSSKMDLDASKRDMYTRIEEDDDRRVHTTNFGNRIDINQPNTILTDSVKAYNQNVLGMDPKEALEDAKINLEKREFIFDEMMKLQQHMLPFFDSQKDFFEFFEKYSKDGRASAMTKYGTNAVEHYDRYLSENGHVDEAKITQDVANKLSENLSLKNDLSPEDKMVLNGLKKNGFNVINPELKNLDSDTEKVKEELIKVDSMKSDKVVDKLDDIMQAIQDYSKNMQGGGNVMISNSNTNNISQYTPTSQIEAFGTRAKGK